MRLEDLGDAEPDWYAQQCHAGAGADSVSVLFQRPEQRVHEKQRSAEGGLGDPQIQWQIVGQDDESLPVNARSLEFPAGLVDQRMRAAEMVPNFNPEWGCAFFDQFPDVTVHCGTRGGDAEPGDVNRRVVLRIRQRDLSRSLPGRFPGPVPAGRARDVVLPADLRQSDVGNAVPLRESEHRLRPDQVVQRAAGDRGSRHVRSPSAAGA